MPTVIAMKSGTLRTLLSEMIPSQIPLSVVFTLSYIERCRKRIHNSTPTATRQIAVTSHPAQVKPLRMPVMSVPVWRKKVPKVLISTKSVRPTMSSMSSMSTIRSVTTVPRAFVNEMSSQRFSTPQRVNSPMRGMTSEAA